MHSDPAGGLSGMKSEHMQYHFNNAMRSRLFRKCGYLCPNRPAGHQISNGPGSAFRIAASGIRLPVDLNDA